MYTCLIILLNVSEISIPNINFPGLQWDSSGTYQNLSLKIIPIFFIVLAITLFWYRRMYIFKLYIIILFLTLTYVCTKRLSYSDLIIKDANLVVVIEKTARFFKNTINLVYIISQTLLCVLLYNLIVCCISFIKNIHRNRMVNNVFSSE